MKAYRQKRTKAQIIIEFTFCMIMFTIMVYGVLQVFKWVGKDYGRRQKEYDKSWSPSQRISEVDFYKPSRINGVMENAL